MSVVFYHSVIHVLGFFICFKIKSLRAKNNKTRFFYVLYADKTWIFDQSERALGPIIYILIRDICNYSAESKTKEKEVGTRPFLQVLWEDLEEALRLAVCICWKREA